MCIILSDYHMGWLLLQVPLTTEDQMFDLIDKACGKGGRPVPFRGAYELIQTEQDNNSRQKDDFALRRRDPPISPSQVPDGWVRIQDTHRGHHV